MKVLVSCPPMLRMMESLEGLFSTRGMEVFCPEVIQTLSESELIELVPQFDGWIIGDDPATRAVLTAGKSGRLKAVVKWGIGVDNVDFAACKSLGLPVSNTPMMFGREVADMAMSYIIALARETFAIHAGVKEGHWPKPRGISLEGKTLGLIGFGDIGRNVARRAAASDMPVIAYDPAFSPVDELPAVSSAQWPERLDECDFIVITCSLTEANRHMLNAQTLSTTKKGVRVVNVARGPLIDEQALIDALRTGQVHSAALDVFEEEPLPVTSPLREFDRCIFGSHNGSNTEDAVRRASERAVELLYGFLVNDSSVKGSTLS